MTPPFLYRPEPASARDGAWFVRFASILAARGPACPAPRAGAITGAITSAITGAAPAQTTRAFTALAALMALISLVASLAGCTTPARSVDQLQPADPALLAASRREAAEASAQLLENQDALQAAIARQAPLPPAPAVPEDDPLSKKTLNISVQDAHAGQLLWILATEFRISLSIDPAVLALPQVANLHLQQVTGREALDQILALFDISARMSSGKVLTVTLMDERMFDIESLVGRSSLDMSAGGDLFGAGGKGSGSLRDNLSMSGEFGEKGDGFEALGKSVEAILAETPGGKDTNGVEREKARFTLDRGAGLLFVRARPARLRAVAELVERGKTFRKRQVQIEAQLIDVQLNDESQLGVDWTLLGRHIAARLGTSVATLASASLPLGGSLNGRQIVIPAQAVGNSGAAGGGLALTGNSFSATLKALRIFGALRVLSNPTVRVRNGMPAYLSVGNNIRYIQKITSNTNTTAAGSTTSVDVTTDALFSGVVLGVNALVKADGFVELFVRPSQTQVQEKSLERVDIGAGNMVTLPVTNSKSITTTLNIRDGDTIVIGGLIDQQLTSSGSGVPGLADIRGAGSIFGNAGQQQATRELVVVLRVRVL